MDDLLAWIAGTELAGFLRQSRWGYAAVNTAHVLAIALLVGAIVPLDLRLMGWWREVEHTGLARVLAASATIGLVTAVLSGTLLFSIRAPEYAGNPAFLSKLALVAMGTVSAVLHHVWHGVLLEGASNAQLRTAGLISLMCWIGALVSGRLIAFLGD